MKSSKPLFIYLLIVSFPFFLGACGVNLFSPFNPANSDSEDPATLISLGDNFLYTADYTNAYKCYSKAMKLSPGNSLAIWGSTIAYIDMKIAPSNLITAMIASPPDFSRLGFNNLYTSGSFVSVNLYKIINGNCDGVIAKNDSLANFNYYLFNSFYAFFYFVDTDNNGNVENDTNDLLSISNDFSVVIRFTNLEFISNFAKRVGSINILRFRKINYSNQMFLSQVGYSNYYSVLKTDASKNSFKGISSVFSSLNTTITNMFTNLDHTYASNNFILGGNNTNITNYIESTYSAFRQELSNGGINSVMDVTNIMPDLSNIREIITNFYGIPNL